MARQKPVLDKIDVEGLKCDLSKFRESTTLNRHSHFGVSGNINDLAVVQER